MYVHTSLSLLIPYVFDTEVLCRFRTRRAVSTRSYRSTFSFANVWNVNASTARDTSHRPKCRSSHLNPNLNPNPLPSLKIKSPNPKMQGRITVWLYRAFQRPRRVIIVGCRTIQPPRPLPRAVNLALAILAHYLPMYPARQLQQQLKPRLSPLCKPNLKVLPANNRTFQCLCHAHHNRLRIEGVIL